MTPACHPCLGGIMQWCERSPWPSGTRSVPSRGADTVQVSTEAEPAARLGEAAKEEGASPETAETSSLNPGALEFVPKQNASAILPPVTPPFPLGWDLTWLAECQWSVLQQPPGLGEDVLERHPFYTTPLHALFTTGDDCHTQHRRPHDRRALKGPRQYEPVRKGSRICDVCKERPASSRRRCTPCREKGRAVGDSKNGSLEWSHRDQRTKGERAMKVWDNRRKVGTPSSGCREQMRRRLDGLELSVAVLTSHVVATTPLTG